MKKVIKEVVPYLVIILVVVLIRSFLFTPIKVNGTSMNPTLKDGDFMIVNKISKVDRFDIVVIKSKKSKEVLIKRVIGMPGETIEISDGIIYINGKKLKDKYGKGKTNDIAAIDIGDNEYYVLGDNREVSLDSRYFGSFKDSEIFGTTRLTIFPFNRIGNKK